MLWVLALNAFWFILLTIFVEVLLGGFLFYKYVVVAEQRTPEVTKNFLKFNEKAYNNVMQELQNRGQ
jgi:hypothetical protein